MRNIIILKTQSSIKLEEISNHFKKYNITIATMENDNKCVENTVHVVINGKMEEFKSSRLSEIKDLKVLAILDEKSFIEKSKKGIKAKVTSILTVELPNVPDNTKVYINTIEGILLPKTVDENAWGWDGLFVPDGLMLTYSDLKKKGLKISPRDMNIGSFLKDYVWHENVHWSHCSIKMSRPIDLEADYQTVLETFFGPALNSFSRNVVTRAVNNGLFLRAANTRKMGNYWWPSGNAGLPITPKSKDIMHERTYMMHDIFHFHIPDLIYTGIEDDPVFYDWYYTAHRLMTECFTLVLGDMLYVHECILRGINYETVDKRKIYQIYKAIYEYTGRSIDNTDHIKELTYASAHYGMLGSESAFIDLFKKNNPGHNDKDIDAFLKILEDFRSKYDAYIIQDLKWTKHNVENMRNNAHLFRIWHTMIPQEISIGLGLQTVESVMHTSILTTEKDVVNHLFEKISNQLMTNIGPKNQVLKPKSPLVMKFSRWAIGQLFFFAKFDSVPFISGYSKYFIGLLNEIWNSDPDLESVQKSLVQNFRHQWEFLMNSCVKYSILTQEEADQYSEVYPIFDPHYIGGYTYDEKNHTETMKEFFLIG